MKLLVIFTIVIKEVLLNLENYFIAQFQNKHIGDDGALVGKSVYSKDAFFENVHFKTQWMTHYQIAKKAMLVNISDAVAMNAKPKYALLSVAMPSSITQAQMRALSKGFQDVAKEFGITIIGGDTISNTKLDITITIISEAARPLLRKGLRCGDLLAYTGELGRSKKELQKLLRLGTIHTASKFVNIQLRDDFIRRSRTLLHAGMDISDGLFSDLEKLAKVNRLGFRFVQKISKEVACSGEEYEMLVAFSPRNKKALLRRAQQTRTPLKVFAKALRKKYTNRCKAHHF